MLVLCTNLHGVITQKMEISQLSVIKEILWTPLKNFTFNCIPIIINFPPNNVQGNATHFTNLHMIFNGIMLTQDLHSNVVLPSVLYLSTVSIFVKKVSCFWDTGTYCTGYCNYCYMFHILYIFCTFINFKCLLVLII